MHSTGGGKEWREGKREGGREGEIAGPLNKALRMQCSAHFTVSTCSSRRH